MNINCYYNDGTQNNAEDAESFFNKAIEHYNKQEWKLAIHCLTQVEELSSEQKHPDASYNKGCCYVEEGNYTEAIKSFTKAEEDSLEKKFPLASYSKGISYFILKEYDKAIQSFTKSEQDSPEQKNPDASYNKGCCYDVQGKYEKAIQSFTKSELDSPNQKRPIASNEKGLCYVKLAYNKKTIGSLSEAEEIFKKAIQSFTKSELDSPNQKHPNASLSKSSCYYELKDYDNAILASTKAEEDSIEKKFPLASYNKGISYFILKEYDKAIQSFTKSEQDSPEQKNPDASYNKGFCYEEQGNYEEAIKSFAKAEEDSPEQKYPKASFAKGFRFAKQGNYSDAIKAYTKCERDSPEQKHPQASYGKGYCYRKEGSYKEAILSFTKAEEDSQERKYPDASYAKGNAYGEQENYEEAIKSYIKAEEDSPEQKYPYASYNKGISYAALEKYDKAISSYQKAIEDSDNNFYPDAHLQLAKLYRPYEADKAKNHAFEALCQDSRSYEIVEFIAEYFSDDYTCTIYKNRLAYLDTLFAETVSEYIQSDNKAYETQWKRVVKNSEDKDKNSTAVFYALLKNKENLFPVNISYQDRLRVAYLLSFINNEPWNIFYIIDELLADTTDGLDEIDWYFYLYSACQIGEPVTKINYFLNNSQVRDTSLGVAYNNAVSAISHILADKKMADSYLLDLSGIRCFEMDFVDIRQYNYHQWVTDVLHTFNEENKSYQLPYKENELTGMLSQMLIKEAGNELSEEDKQKSEWKDFCNALEKVNTDAKHLVEKIREGINKGIPYGAYICHLNAAILEETDDIIKRKLSIAVGAAIGTYYFDVCNRILPKNNSTKTVIVCFVDATGNKWISTLISCGLIASAGISITLSLLIMPFLFDKADYYLNRKKQTEAFFKKVYEELEALDNNS